MTTGKKIIALRKKNNWSQAELSKQLFVSRQAISKWENDQSIPDIDNILRMCELFQVSTDYLLTDNAKPKTANASNLPRILAAILASLFLLLGSILLIRIIGTHQAVLGNRISLFLKETFPMNITIVWDFFIMLLYIHLPVTCAALLLIIASLCTFYLLFFKQKKTGRLIGIVMISLSALFLIYILICSTCIFPITAFNIQYGIFIGINIFHLVAWILCTFSQRIRF